VVMGRQRLQARLSSRFRSIFPRRSSRVIVGRVRLDLMDNVGDFRVRREIRLERDECELYWVYGGCE
jgi:hypothetical protein